MTPDELDAIRERARRASVEWAKPVFPGSSDEIYKQGVVSASAHDVPTLLACVEQLERERARSVARYADAVGYGQAGTDERPGRCRMTDEPLSPSELSKLLADALERMPVDEFTVYVHPGGMEFVPYDALAKRCLNRNPKTGVCCEEPLGHGLVHSAASTGETWHHWTYLKSLLDGVE